VTASDRSALRLAVLTRSAFPLHGYGGLERHVHDLVRHLIERNVSIELITRPPARVRPSPGAGEDWTADPRVQVHIVPYRTFPLAGRRGTTVIDRSTAYPMFGERAGRAAARLATAGRVDAVYGLGASALGYARARRRHRRETAPFVFNPQGLEEFGATAPRRARLKRIAYLPLQRAVRTCAHAADRVIATDRALEPAVLEHLAIPRDRVRVVPNGIDVRAADRLADPAAGARLRHQLSLAPRAALLLSAGRIEENKGLHVLARALGAARSLPEWRWMHVGHGPFRARLERAIAEAGIGDRVVFAGRIEDQELHASYEAATLFVHPTLYEGSSLVTLEAMAHRRAVVASAAGGLPDKVRPGVNGWLVPPGEAAALAAALEAALAPDVDLGGMGAAGRAIVEREFAWTTIAGRLIELFHEVVEEARG
jgi:glycosyltransferase involved in cell wall biosynthesis